MKISRLRIYIKGRVKVRKLEYVKQVFGRKGRNQEKRRVREEKAVEPCNQPI